jgi:phenylpropionate dioxygenase-like ring-hydroxylating dioxygenase large terminal subunit
LIGRTDYIKQPGDYFTHSFAGTSLIIMRGEDGRLRAFVNACRHRGAKLLEGAGTCRTIVCPYHSWVYSQDGSLRVANAMRDTKDFDAREFGLQEVMLDTWSGFIFVNCDLNAMPLRTYLGNLDDYTASYNFAEMVTTKRQEYKIRTNWKCYIENSLENLHLPTVHQKSIGSVKAEWIPVNGSPGNFVMLRSRTNQSRAVLDGDSGFDPIAGLSGTAAEGAQYILVYPYTVIGADLDCMWFKQMVPDGPDRVRNVAAFCFTKEAVARPDFDRIVQNYYRRYDVVISEDNGISETQYAGLENPLTKPGRFSNSEQLVHTIDNWILDRVLGPEHRA